MWIVFGGGGFMFFVWVMAMRSFSGSEAVQQTLHIYPIHPRIDYFHWHHELLRANISW
jgi:hypothetical protein